MPKSAGAGRGFVNPQRTDESDADYITPSQRADMEREVADQRASAAAEAAYNKASGMKKGGKVSGSASKRADGIAQRGKTRGTIVMCGGGMYKK